VFPCFSSPSMWSLRGYSDEEISHGASRLGYAEVQMAQASLAPPQYGLIRKRWDFSFKLSCPSHEWCPVSQIYRFNAIGSGNYHAQRNIGFKTLRLVYSTPCSDAPVGHWDNLLYGALVAGLTCTFLHPCLVKTVSRSCLNRPVVVKLKSVP
jgi:hypothetical protein